jgi:hypothetical protein
MGELYRDRWITCDEQELHIRGYYFPWGTKTIPYAAVRGVRRVAMTITTGRGRIWGTGNPRYWLSLDPGRPRKTAGLILDLGRHVSPFITPDDPDAVEALLRARAGGGNQP